MKFTYSVVLNLKHLPTVKHLSCVLNNRSFYKSQMGDSHLQSPTKLTPFSFFARSSISFFSFGKRCLWLEITKIFGYGKMFCGRAFLPSKLPFDHERVGMCHLIKISMLQWRCYHRILFYFALSCIPASSRQFCVQHHTAL